MSTCRYDRESKTHLTREHLAERYGLPHWATRPRTTTISRRHMEEA